MGVHEGVHIVHTLAAFTVAVLCCPALLCCPRLALSLTSDPAHSLHLQAVQAGPVPVAIDPQSPPAPPPRRLHFQFYRQPKEVQAGKGGGRAG